MAALDRAAEMELWPGFDVRGYPVAIYDGNQVGIVISQSGETADTLAALRYCEQKAMTLGVVNVAESSIAREADLALPILAGGLALARGLTLPKEVVEANVIQQRAYSSPVWLRPRGTPGDAPPIMR